LPRPHSDIKGHRLTHDRLFLFGELLSTNVCATELNIEHTLHRAKNLLIGGGGTTLEVLDNGHGGVALGGEFLLSHLVALLSAASLDSITDGVADSLRLDDVVATVDLGQVLAFGGSGLGALQR
jgi:hypothetical protein